RLCGISGEPPVEDASQPRPVDGSQAHRAWLTRGVKLAPLEFKAAKRGACLADGEYFGMSRGVVRGGDPIRAFGHDALALHNHSAERAAPTRSHVFDRELYCTCHKSVVHVF